MSTTVEVLASAFKDAGTPFIVGHPGGELYVGHIFGAGLYFLAVAPPGPCAAKSLTISLLSTPQMILPFGKALAYSSWGVSLSDKGQRNSHDPKWQVDRECPATGERKIFRAAETR